MQINCHAVLTNRQQPTFKVELVAFIAPHMNGIVVVSAVVVRLGLIQILNISMITRWMSGSSIGKEKQNGWK